MALIRLPLREGSNRLLLRVDVDWSSPFWWLRVCTRGTPRPAAEVKAAEEAKAAVLVARILEVQEIDEEQGREADRLDTVGGTLTLESVPGSGTTVRGSVPIGDRVRV